MHFKTFFFFLQQNKLSIPFSLNFLKHTDKTSTSTDAVYYSMGYKFTDPIGPTKAFTSNMKRTKLQNRMGCHEQKAAQMTL